MRRRTQTNIGREAVENMPTLSRSLQDLTRLTPQGGANSFAGSNFRYNNLAIDGAVANDAQCETLIRLGVEACERYYPAVQYVCWAGKSANAALESSLLETMGEA